MLALMPLLLLGHATPLDACEAAVGYLSLNTRPWTRVVVDGDVYGSTPLFKLPLSPGAHVVRLTNDALGIDVVEPVEIEEGAVRKLRLVLAAEAARELDEQRPPSGLDEDCDAPSDPAFLSVGTTPWSRVSLDGKALGSTPLFKQRIAPGPHFVTLRAEGAARPAVVAFEAVAGEIVHVVVPLAMDPAGVDAADATTPVDPADGAAPREASP